MSISNILVPNNFDIFMNNLQMQQYKLNNFADLTIAIGINQNITANTLTQLNNFTGAFGNLPGMNLATGVFTPDLISGSGLYLWQIQLVVTGLVGPSNITIYFYDDTNLVNSSTHYLANDLSATSYASLLAATTLFPIGQQTLKCVVLCADNVTLGGIWGIQRLYRV